MKEVFSAFGSEVYRPLVTMVLPGAIGVFPWFAAITERSESVRSFVGGHPPESTVCFLLATLFFGHLFEDIGSRIEGHWFDERIKKTRPSHEDDWYLYLRTAYRIEPVGHRFLRTLVLRLKFELNNVPALVSLAVGCWFTQVVVVPPYVICGVALVIAAYLFCEARISHRTLSEVREQLLKGINEKPNASPVSPQSAG